MSTGNLRPGPLRSPASRRVLVISHLYPSAAHPTHGIFIHQSVRALRELGLDLRVISPVPWPPPLLRRRPKWAAYARILAEGDTFDGVPVKRVGYLTAPYPLYAFAGIGMALALRGVIERIRRIFAFDLVHAHNLTPDGWAACLLRRRLGTPVVSSIRGSDLNLYPDESRVIRSATRHVLRRCDAVVAVSGALAAKVPQLEPTVRPARVIYNGVDLCRFRESPDRASLRDRLGLPREAKVILQVGNCVPDKGIPELVAAFVRLQARHRNLILVLLGDGESKDWARAQGEPLGGAIRTPGRVAHDVVAQYCQAADCFAFPSHSEGMPNALLEAMGAGLPCVATRVGGVPEAMEDGVSGLMIAPRDPAAIELALERLLTEPDLAQRLGAAAARSIERRFSWDAHARAYAELYEQLCVTGSARG